MNTLFSKAQHNRRSICRIPLQLPIHLFVKNDSGRKHKAMSVNLHYRGVEIITDTKISKGTSVRMRLPQSVTGRRTSTTPGEVRWVANTEDQYKYGVSFKEDFRWVFTLTKDILPDLRSDEDASVAKFVLNSLNDGVFSVNRKWQIISFNQAAERFTGLQREEVIGRHCREVFKACGCDDCILAESIRRGKPLVSHSRFITTAQGKRLLVNINATPLVGGDGKISGGVQVFHLVSSAEDQDVIPDAVSTSVRGPEPIVNIQTFGSFCLKVNGRPLFDRLWKGRRSKVLLKAIIALGGSKVSMEKLAMVLWPDSDGDRAMNNLKMALSRLRRIGGDEFSIPPNWLVVKHRRVSLVRSMCWVDALEFARELRHINNFDGAQSLQHVLALYSNDFLPQDETPWIYPFREHLRKLFLEGALHFATLQNADSEVVQAFLEQARHVDPLNEAVYACLMKHYIEAGFPATALDIYHKAEKNIFLQTRIAPGKVLQSLAEQAKKASIFD